MRPTKAQASTSSKSLSPALRVPYGPHPQVTTHPHLFHLTPPPKTPHRSVGERSNHKLLTPVTYHLSSHTKLSLSLPSVSPPPRCCPRRRDPLQSPPWALGDPLPAPGASPGARARTARWVGWDGSFGWSSPGTGLIQVSRWCHTHENICMLTPFHHWRSQESWPGLPTGRTHTV